MISTEDKPSFKSWENDSHILPAICDKPCIATVSVLPHFLAIRQTPHLIWFISYHKNCFSSYIARVSRIWSDCEIGLLSFFLLCPFHYSIPLTSHFPLGFDHTASVISPLLTANRKWSHCDWTSIYISRRIWLYGSLWSCHNSNKLEFIVINSSHNSYKLEGDFLAEDTL